MKASTALSVAMAGSAMAAGGADTINQVLNDIATALKSFDTAIKGYSGGSVDTLTQASGKIQQITSSGAQKISSGSDLTLNDAVSITTNVQGLQTTLDTTLTDLEGIGSKLASAGQCGTITSQLNTQSSAAKALQEAITSKAPTETKSIAQQLGGKIGASIANTQSKFTQICAGAPSGGSSSGGASGGSSTGSASGSSASAGHSGSGHSGMAGMGGSSSGSSSSGSTGASSGSTGSSSSSGKGSASSTVPKPAQYTGSATSLNAYRALGLGFAAAVLAL